MRTCPECSSDNVATERRLNGESKCVNCGYRDLTTEFDRHNEKPSYKELEKKLVLSEASYSVASKSNRVFIDQIRGLQDKLAIAVEALKEAHSLIKSTGYTIDNGKYCMDGNEWPWIERGLSVMDEALKQLSEG